MHTPYKSHHWEKELYAATHHGKIGKNASGDENAVYLERIAYKVMAYLEKRHCKYLTIHPEDEFNPDQRMGLLSLKILAKQAGIGWQGRSLLIVSPHYGPLHRLIAVVKGKYAPNTSLEFISRNQASPSLQIIPIP